MAMALFYRLLGVSASCLIALETAYLVFTRPAGCIIETGKASEVALPLSQHILDENGSSFWTTKLLFKVFILIREDCHYIKR